MDMVYNNPGEAPTITKYNNPEYLKTHGFNAMVTHWYINCAIAYDNVENGLVPLNTDERVWIENKADYIQEKIALAEEHNIDVYPFTDFLVFPKSVWEKYGEAIKWVGVLHLSLIHI